LYQKLAETARIVKLDKNDVYSAHNRPRKLKLVSLEAPGNEDSEYVFKTSNHVCERNSNAKCLISS
jgi:hypothetical protein